jgi:hypothetical protein
LQGIARNMNTKQLKSYLRRIGSHPCYRRRVEVVKCCTQYGLPPDRAIAFAGEVEEEVFRYRKRAEHARRESKIVLLSKAVSKTAKKALGLLNRKTFRPADFHRVTVKLNQDIKSLGDNMPTALSVCAEFGIEHNLVRWATGRKLELCVGCARRPAVRRCPRFNSRANPFAPDFEGCHVTTWADPRELNPLNYSDPNAQRGILRLIAARFTQKQHPRGAPVDLAADELIGAICHSLEDTFHITAHKGNKKAISILQDTLAVYGLGHQVQAGYRIKRYDFYKQKGRREFNRWLAAQAPLERLPSSGH